MINILFNAFGIKDSGGIRVIEKILDECIRENEYIYFVYVNNSVNINRIIHKYKKNENLEFQII